MATEFDKGIEWADKHPYISYEDIENAAKEVIDKDWQVQQDMLWTMIEKNLLAKFIEKACEWLKEEYPKAAAYYEHPDNFIGQFKRAMKEG